MIRAIPTSVTVLLALAYQGITYTTREKVIDLGSLTASVERTGACPCLPSSPSWR